jgi:tetratricopeptide (TPR) repeat protein
VMSELYFLLAQAQSAAGAGTADVTPSYRKAVTVSSWSRQYVPALWWLFRHVSASEYAATVSASFRNNKDPCPRIHLLAAELEKEGNWKAFEQFLDAAVPEVADKTAFAAGIGRGLSAQSRWAIAFLQYCRNRPLLRPWYVAERRRVARENAARHDFAVAIDIYRSLAAEGGAEEKPTAYEREISESLFYNGQYQQAVSHIERLVAGHGTTDNPEIGRLLLLQGRAHLQLGQLDRAAEVFSRLAADPAGDMAPEAGFLVGYCHLLQKDLEQARRTFTAVAEQYPQNPFACKARLGLRRIERTRP